MKFKIWQNPWKYPPENRQNEWVSFAIRLILVAVGYYAGAYVGLLTVLQPEGLAGVWPASGTATAALILSRRAKRPKTEYWATGGLIFTLNVISNLIAHNTFPVSVGFGLANTIEPIVASMVFVFLVRLLSKNQNDPQDPYLLNGFRGIVVTIAAAITTIISGFVGAFVPMLGFGSSYWDVWKVWWISDGLGIILITPLLLLLITDNQSVSSWSIRKWMEYFLLLLCIGAASWFSFGLGDINAPFALRPYLIFLILFWASLRFSYKFISLGLIILTGVALYCTLTGLGAFPISGASHVDRLIFAQEYIYVSVLIGLILATVFSERHKAEMATKYQATLLENITDAVISSDTNFVIRSWNRAAEEMYGWKAEEVIGHPESQFLKSEFGGNDRTADDSFFQTGLWKGEGTQLRKDGKRIKVLSTVRIIKDPNTDISTVISTNRDITEIKLAEEKIETSERTLQLFVEFAPAAIAMFDRDMRYLAVSQRFMHDYQVKDKNIIGRSHYEIFPNLPERWKEVHQRCLAGASEKAEADQMQNPDGSIEWINWEIYPWYSKPGEIGGILLSSEIITEREKEKDRIVDLVERIDLATRAAQLGIWDWDIPADKLIWDDRMYELYGIQKDEFGGAYEAWFKGVHPEDKPKCDVAIKQALDGTKEYDLEFRVLWPDSSVHWIKANALTIRDTHDKPMRMIGINYDTTERKQAEETLRERNNFIEDILENAPIGFAINRISDGMGTFVSRKFDTLYGVDIGGMNTVDEYFEKVYLDPQFREKMRERMLTDMATGDASKMRWENIPITTKDGEFKVVSAINIPMFEQNLMISTVQDVTVQWQAAEEIRKLNTELEQRVARRTLQLEEANKELEAFSYSVSHDLRAPLRGIDGWSLALMEDYSEALDEKGRQYIDRVRKETQHMGQLIDDLLRLSRISRTEMIVSSINLSKLVETISTRLMESQPDRSIEWVIEPDLIANGDNRLLEIAMTNLLANSFKFTGKEKNAKIEFGRTNAEGKDVYFVRDNGAGFNMEYAKNLFGAFQRMHKQSEFPGTGIGLATVQRIIRRHGGTLWAEAEVDKGATFYFTLGDEG